jgi:peptide chain release factor subunit 1
MLVPVITEAAVRELAGFNGEGVPVTTCYLDVDGRRYHRHLDYEQELERLLRGARGMSNGTPSVNRDLKRIEDFVKGGLDRSRTRGLAIFSCSQHDLWRVVALPKPVRNQLVINEVPAVGQLEAAVEESERFGVLLVDKQRARVFVFEMGELIERSERLDELPRDYDQRGERDQGDVSNHVDALTSQHLKRAGAAAFAVFQEHHFEHFSLGAPDELIRSVESCLHPYLRERSCGRIGVAPGASLDEIRHAVLGLEAQQERAKEAALVERLRAAVGAGRRGVAGLDDTLPALGEHRVEVLLVSAGYSEEGWRCPSSGRLARVGPKSPVTGERMNKVADVVEEAVDEALNQNCRVEVCVANADLDVLGRIGALLRY